MVVDDTSRQMNVSLAMKHSYFQREGTSSGPQVEGLKIFPDNSPLVKLAQ